MAISCAGLLAGMMAAGRPEPDHAAYAQIAAETEANLKKHVLAMWYPRAMNQTFGGFRQEFDEQWQPIGQGRDRSIVYQARLTWTAARAGISDPVYRPYAKHGFEWLRNAMWDLRNGGFFWQIDASTREPSGPLAGEKHLYGESFGIYAATVGDHRERSDTFALARRAFQWLDDHAHDSAHGGYFEQLSRDGKPIMTAPRPGAKDAIGTEYGLKSMNSHIHLLEALTTLHAVWPDARVKQRLYEVFHIVRDKVYSEPGFLNLYFRPDWSPVPDHDSYGHDIETAYLLVEAAAELGMPSDKSTWQRARRLVDHALQYGWDEEHGGFYDFGPPNKPAERREKVWWTEAEGLNALLLMHERFGKQTPRYWQAFVKQWEFIKNHQLDAVNGGWRSEVKPDGTPIPGRAKSDAWTECYHQGRALMNVTETLRRLRRTAAH